MAAEPNGPTFEIHEEVQRLYERFRQEMGPDTAPNAEAAANSNGMF